MYEEYYKPLEEKKSLSEDEIKMMAERALRKCACNTNNKGYHSKDNCQWI